MKQERGAKQDKGRGVPEEDPDGWPLDVKLKVEKPRDFAAPPLGFDCPRCKKPMEGGFVHAGKGLTFRKKGGLQLTVFGGIRIISVMRAWSTPACRCPDCQLVLIDPT